MADEFPTTTCRKCGKVFQHWSSKCRHEKKCKKGPDALKVKKTFNCSNVWCDKVFNKISNYKRHLTTCQRKPKKSHKCNNCGKFFDKLSRLLRHEVVHNKETFTCGQCFNSYKREDKFQEHKKRCRESSTVTSALLHMTTMATDSNIEQQQQHNICQDLDVEQAFEVEGEETESFHGQPSHAQFTAVHEAPYISNVDEQSDCDEDWEQQVDNSISNEQPSCSSSFIDAFRDGININDTAISTETPSVYVLDDNDYDIDMFANMEFLRADSPPSYSKHQFNSDVADCTVKHLKSLKHQSKRSNVKQQEFSKLCLLLYRQKIDDIEFMNALAAELSFQSREELLDFINNNDTSGRGRGRPMSSK